MTIVDIGFWATLYIRDFSSLSWIVDIWARYQNDCNAVLWEKVMHL